MSLTKLLAGILGAALFALASAGVGSAQTPGLGPLAGDTVTWTVAPSSTDPVRPGARLTLTLEGTVKDGWHVYGLKQLPGGPIPLRVTVVPGDLAAADGGPTASPPTRLHDPSFDLDTEVYAHPFTVTAPVRIGAHPATGRQSIPVDVRFQTCNGQICQPPKTVRLNAPVTVRADG